MRRGPKSSEASPRTSAQVSLRPHIGQLLRFAHMKRIHKLDRLRLRGLSGAKDEVLLTALAQNLKRLAKFVRQSAEPRPMPA